MSNGEGGVARRVPLPDGTYTRPEPDVAAKEPDVVAKVVESPRQKRPRKTGGAQTK